MTDLTELLRLAAESGAAMDMADQAAWALREAADALSDEEKGWLRFAIGVSRGMKQRGRSAVPSEWRPEIAVYLDRLEPLSLAALAALVEAVG